MRNDPYRLHRFIEAQEGSFESALAEIKRGSKRGHWMWFVFPQLAGLARSETAQHFAITSLDEARAYLAHPVLGLRLIASVEALQDLAAASATDVFGGIDALKLRSSLTLFWQAGGGPIFEAAISRWFGSPDPLTMDILGSSRRESADQ